MEKDTNSDTENISSLFRPGYVFEVEIIDFDSPQIKAEIARVKAEQQEILSRTYVDAESLEKRMGI